MKIQATNTTKVDIVVDINGNNDIKDKVILHPKNSLKLEITDSQFTKIKSINGLVVTPTK
jgi:hypothetical protein